ncbi:MAG TPA: permease-like cell division protein FtsX [Bacteroidia bacterium]
MSLNTEKKYKKRTSFWPTIISMSLVLFIVGLLGVISIYAKNLASFYQDNFEIFVYFSDSTDKAGALKLEKEIRKMDFVNSTFFIDRDIAARKESEKLGNDFVKTLGYNPIPHSLQINIKSTYAEQGKIELVEKQLRRMDNIDDVNYAKDDLGKNLLTELSKTFKTVEIILLTLAVIFLIICLVLINSTVRINMFARRFIIKSMQYVGASDWFIIRPFLGMYFIYAVISVLVSIAMLSGVIYIAENSLQQNNWQLFLPKYALLAGFLLVLAVLISLISVYFSTKRYLKLKIDQLY